MGLWQLFTKQQQKKELKAVDGLTRCQTPADAPGNQHAAGFSPKMSRWLARDCEYEFKGCVTVFLSQTNTPFCDGLPQPAGHTLHHSACLRCQNHLGDKESPLPPVGDTSGTHTKKQL